MTNQRSLRRACLLAARSCPPLKWPLAWGTPSDPSLGVAYAGVELQPDCTAAINQKFIA
jgi:hypothetical protein